MDHRVIACWRHMLPGDRYRWTTEGWLAGCMLLSERYRWIGLLAFPLHGERYRWTTEVWLAGCTCYLAKGSDGPEDWLAGCTCYLAKGSDGPEDWLAGCTCYLAKGSESDGPRRAGLLAAHVTWRKVLNQMDHGGQACWLHMLPGERFRWTTDGRHVTWRKVQMDHRGLACWLHMLLSPFVCPGFSA